MELPDQTLTPSADPTHPGSPSFWLRELYERYEELGIRPHKQVDQKIHRQADFLAAYVRQAGTTLAAGLADCTVNTFHKWRNEDPIFAQCLPYAHEARSDTLIFEARRRGVDGVEKTIRDKRTGEVVGVEREYSTQLLLKLMQGLDPEGRFWNRPAPASADGKDSWRAALAKLMDKDPEALALIDELADKMVGEDQSVGTAESE